MDTGPFCCEIGIEHLRRNISRVPDKASSKQDILNQSPDKHSFPDNNGNIGHAPPQCSLRDEDERRATLLLDLHGLSLHGAGAAASECRRRVKMQMQQHLMLVSYSYSFGNCSCDRVGEIGISWLTSCRQPSLC